MIQPVQVGHRLIGPGQPCFIIAEAGVNHNGSMETAKELVRTAAEVGADAVKFQTFSVDAVIVPDAPKAAYQRQITPSKESQFEMLEKLVLTYEDFRVLKALADESGIIFLSTPHSPEDIEFLISLGVPALKVPSMDIVNYPLLAHYGRQGVPVIVSTGMATLGEVERALDILRQNGSNHPILLHCVTNYPIENEQANLLVMDTLRQAFQIPIGFSDHTTGIAVPIAAVARGACIIEKHFTLDKSLPGPDQAASLDPEGFRSLVKGIRAVESALGKPEKQVQEIEIANRATMRRSLVADEDIPAGTLLENRHLALKRPGTGLGAECIPMFIGRRTLHNVSKNQMITLDILLPNDRLTSKTGKKSV